MYISRTYITYDKAYNILKIFVEKLDDKAAFYWIHLEVLVLIGDEGDGRCNKREDWSWGLIFQGYMYMKCLIRGGFHAHAHAIKREYKMLL